MKKPKIKPAEEEKPDTVNSKLLKTGTQDEIHAAIMKRNGGKAWEDIPGRRKVSMKLIVDIASRRLIPLIPKEAQNMPALATFVEQDEIVYELFIAKDGQKLLIASGKISIP